MPAHVIVRSAPLTALARRVSDPAAKAVVHKKLGAIYRSFAAERFNKFARGGGNWPKLSKATEARRRKPKKKTANISHSILIDTGTLQAALNPVLSPGGLEESKGNIVRLGFGGPAKHPSTDGLTIADIASFHHFGTKTIPERPIIVAPDTATLSLMTRKIEQWIQSR